MPFIFMVTIITPIIVVFVSFIIVSSVITSVAVSSVVVSTVLRIPVYIVPVIVGNLLSLIIILSFFINKSVVLRMISYHKIFLITTVPYNGLLSSPVTTILISVISIS